MLLAVQVKDPTNTNLKSLATLPCKILVGLRKVTFDISQGV